MIAKYTACWRRRTSRSSPDDRVRHHELVAPRPRAQRTGPPLTNVASVFITGSADGLGRLAAQRLVTSGHDVVLHGRDQHRAQEAMRAVPGARTALAGNLASIEETRAVAEQANAAGPFQTVIHNAAIFRPNGPRLETVDGLEETFAVNALAPYLLTALVADPRRLVFLSSELHQMGRPDLSDLQPRRRWSGFQAYSKLETISRCTRLRCRAALAARPVERGQSRGSSHQNGWPRGP